LVHACTLLQHARGAPRDVAVNHYRAVYRRALAVNHGRVGHDCVARAAVGSSRGEDRHATLFVYVAKRVNQEARRVDRPSQVDVAIAVSALHEQRTRVYMGRCTRHCQYQDTQSAHRTTQQHSTATT
jgi:hypothetical protein